MSYEGYHEHLCENGHHLGNDCYASDPKKCPHCGAAMAWFHSVDQTNGYDKSDPATCDAPRAIKGTADVWHKDHHGNGYATRLMEFEPAPGSAWRRVNSKRKPRHKNVFASVDRSPKGQDGETRLDAKHESAVGDSRDAQGPSPC